MHKELSESTAWLAQQLVKVEADRAAFAMELSMLLEARFTGHWYPEEPHRGCAFRAISCDGGTVDALLKRAAVAAGVSCSLPSPDTEFTLWINPGEVKALSGGVTHKVFTSGEQNSNPYLKPRVKLERTKILCAASSRRTTASSDGSLTPSTRSRSQSPPLSPSGTHAPSPPASPTTTALSPAANEFTMPPPPPAMGNVHGMVPPPPGLFVAHPQHWQMQMQMQEQLWAAHAYGVEVY